MLNKKGIKELTRLIGCKWFLSTEILAERAGVCAATIGKVLRGEGIGEAIANKLRKFLDNYKGEVK